MAQRAERAPAPAERSPTFATRTPKAVRPKPLRVSRIGARLSLRDRNRGCPTLRPLPAPVRESNQLRYARRASRQACTNATEATPPSHRRAGVVLARETTVGCTCVSLTFSPAECASWRVRSASLNTTGAQPDVRANIAPRTGVGQAR